MKIIQLADINPSPDVPVACRKHIDYIDTASVVEGKLCCVQRLAGTFPSRAQREIRANDILISSVRPNLRHNYFVSQNENCMIASSGFIHIRVNNPKKVSPRYLYYFLTSPTQVQRYIKIADSSQSAYPSFNKDVIEGLEFPDLPLPTQLRIAGVLGSIDEKIELNRKKIAELEALAKSIYDYWFVQFDFPDKDGKPYKSSGGKMVWNEQLKREVPDGWKAGTVGNFVEIHRGASPRPIQDFLSNNGLRWLKISDATNSTSPFIIDIEDHIRKEGLSKTVALKAGDLVLSNSASPGIPKFLGVNSCIHDGWLYFPQSKVSYEFLFLFLDKIKPSLIPQGNGSVFKNLKTDILKLFPMLKPPTTVLSLFDDMIKPIFMDIRTVVVATKETAILRDTLLPLLMNGQVEVAG